MALLETGMAGGEILKPTAANLFRQRPALAPTAPVAQAQAVAPPPTQPVAQVATQPTAQPIPKAVPSIRPAPQGAGQGGPTKGMLASAEVAGPMGEQYQHQYQLEQPGTATILDKNYYKDLGFSTGKEHAKELRTTLRDIDTQLIEERGAIKKYEVETATARTALDKVVNNAWKNAATANIGVGNTVWKVTPEMAKAIGESLKDPSHYGNIGIAYGPANISVAAYGNKYKEELLFGTYEQMQHHGGMSKKHSNLTTRAEIKALFALVRPRVLQAFKDQSAAKSYAAAKQLGGAGTVFYLNPSDRRSRKESQAIISQLSPQITKVEIDFKKAVAEEAGGQYELLAARDVEAKKSEGILEMEEAKVKGEVSAVQKKQAADREGIATTLSTLFRQRGK